MVVFATFWSKVFLSLYTTFFFNGDLSWLSISLFLLFFIVGCLKVHGSSLSSFFFKLQTFFFSFGPEWGSTTASLFDKATSYCGQPNTILLRMASLHFRGLAVYFYVFRPALQWRLSGVSLCRYVFTALLPNLGDVFNAVDAKNPSMC